MSKKVIDINGNPENSNYSEILEKFIANFEDDFEDFYYEDVLQFGIHAWNLANLKKTLPDDDDIIYKQFSEDRIARKLLMRMIDYKLKRFSAYSDFIIDFDLEVRPETTTLMVSTLTEDEYLANLFQNPERVQNESDFEQNFIDRQAVTVVPLQPFFDWLYDLYPDLEGIGAGDFNVYLLDEETILDEWIKEGYDDIFTRELFAWSTDLDHWPKNRSYKMFKKWFSIKQSEMVFDLEPFPVLKF